MRTKLVTVVVSVAVHGSALAWFARGDEPPPPVVAAVTPDQPQAPVAAPEVVLEVAFVDGEGSGRAATVTGAGTAPRARISTGRRAIEPATTSEVPPRVEPPVVTAPTPPAGTLTMRRGPEVPRVATRIAEALSGQVGLEVEVPDLPGARLAYDLYKVEAKLGDPRWVEQASPEALRVARLERMALREAQKRVELVEQKDGTYQSDKDVFVAHVARDGKVRFEDRPNLRVEGLSGRFDVTDWMMREYGMDPYQSKKLAYLDRTRDQRVEIAKVHRREQLAASAQYMERNLERVWATIPDAAGRKQAVFELWDECAEGGDDREREATEHARAMLVRWVRTKLHGADAFTTDELARLNAQRTSTAVLAP